MAVIISRNCFIWDDVLTTLSLTLRNVRKTISGGGGVVLIKNCIEYKLIDTEIGENYLKCQLRCL